MPRLSKLIEKIEDRLANKWGCWYERNKARVPLYAVLGGIGWYLYGMFLNSLKLGKESVFNTTGEVIESIWVFNPFKNLFAVFTPFGLGVSAFIALNRAQASRRQASRSQRRFFAAREDLHAVGSRITCRMLAVGPRRCLVDCYGYDLDMTQREIRYAAIPDLRTEFHPGSEIDCIVKEYHPRTGELIVSAKETEVNPFFGAEERHPVGSRRFAMISGKYGGGVFCNLPDGVTCMCNYSYQHEDADFMVGEHVMLMVQRYDQEKLQMYGKIMSKW